MFAKKKSKSGRGELTAPVSGRTMPLEDTPDEAFAALLVGDGVSIEPTESVFRSPADGTVAGVAECKHAYSITTDDGLDVLVHIGIDTVELGGECFTPHVSAGDKVQRGDVIAEADIAEIGRRGYSTVTPVVISNIEEVAFFSCREGEVKGGDDTIIDYSF